MTEEAVQQFDQRCPNCQTAYQFSADVLGQTGSCENCGNTIKFVPKVVQEVEYLGPPKETRADGFKHLVGGVIFMTAGGGGLLFSAELFGSVVETAKKTGTEKVTVPVIIPVVLFVVAVLGLLQFGHGLRTVVMGGKD